MKIAFLANTDWYIYNFRLPLAEYLTAAGHEVVMICPDGRYADQLQMRGFRWIQIDIERASVSPFSQLRSIFALYNIYRKERFAIVHHFTLKCVILGTVAAIFTRTRGIVNAVAGLGYLYSSTDMKAHVLRPFMRIGLMLTCSPSNVRVIVQNHEDARLLSKLGVGGHGKVHVIYGSGVNPDKFRPVEGETYDEVAEGREVTILMVGRLLQDKGISEYMAAAREIRANHALMLTFPIRFLIAGDRDVGNPASVSPNTLRAWVMEGNASFLGHVDDMCSLVRAADVVVLPSYREGLPKSLIEAAACGKPLVTTNVPGCNEVVEDGVNGILVPARNSALLAAAIVRLAIDPTMRKTMGDAGRRRVLERFDQAIVHRSTYQTYQELTA